MAMLNSAVKEAVVEALALDDDEVTPESTLMDDLGAESIDLLDILFRIEKSTGVKIEASDLGDYIQGGIPDDEFSDDNEVITAKGAEQLKKVMPQIESDRARRASSRPRRSSPSSPSRTSSTWSRPAADGAGA